MSALLRWWETIEWAGAIAFVLATGVAISMVLLIVGSWWVGFTEHGANLLSTMFGAAIGALATFLGQSRRNTNGNNNQRSAGPEIKHND